MALISVRNRFESYMEQQYPDLSLRIKGDIGSSMKAQLGFRMERELYSEDVEFFEPAVQLMWELFQAGVAAERKATSVTLPALKAKPDSFYDAGYNEGIQDCRKHLTASGIKVR
ncbi:hypothetical protein [Escherichia sp. E1130]|uniref:hypothetical protein n=1 Tax=Escherichia sp. E1130 TaxID=2041645 RepID=UPI00107FFD22|nr:hypothetical protein [Escherichia sp. E1130]TGC25046.1 hypothetical protein CQJ27_13725 [Escherichia sp. E1130]TLI63025.1 hypothetical protein FEK66_23730 [Escherichia sp. E1130]